MNIYILRSELGIIAAYKKSSRALQKCNSYNEYPMVKKDIFEIYGNLVPHHLARSDNDICGCSMIKSEQKIKNVYFLHVCEDDSAENYSIGSHTCVYMNLEDAIIEAMDYYSKCRNDDNNSMSAVEFEKHLIKNYEKGHRIYFMAGDSEVSIYIQKIIIQ